jgi:transcriptional regulator with XRE-family HTH domain
MAKKFSALRAKMSPEAQERVKKQADQMAKDMPLHELRRARGLSQESLATILNVSQVAISKLERRTDMYLSTLRSHIKAMGGDLEIIAKFPDGAVRISNFATEQEEVLEEAFA